MALSDYKLKSADYEGKRIADLSDRPTDDDIEGGDGLSADMLKAYFDYIPITVLGLTKLNGLIDFLTENGGGTLGIDEIDGLTDAQTSVTETIAKLLEMVEYNKDEIEASFANLAGSGRTSETVKQNADNITTIKGSGWTNETIKNNSTQIIAMKGTGWTSESLKALSDTITAFMAQKAAASGLASLDSSGKVVQGIDASNIVSGQVPIWAIPDAVKERVVVVASASEMLALTIDEIQEGDIVCIDDGDSTPQWYRVIDDSLLGAYSAFLQQSTGTLIAETSKYYDPTAVGDLAIVVGFEAANTKITALESRASAVETGKANLSTLLTATISTSAWSGNACTLSVSGVTATSNQEILPQTRSYFSSDDDYIAYLEVYQNANLQENGQAAGQIYLLAMTDVPTVNLPIKIILRGD